MSLDPRGQGWCRDGGELREAGSIFKQQPLPVGGNVPEPFPWRFTQNKKVLINFQRDSSFHLPKKRGNKENSSFLIHATQMGSFNSLAPAYLTSKPHVSCKTLHPRPPPPHPVSFLMSFVCLPGPITSLSHLAAEGRGQCPLCVPASRDDSNVALILQI